MNRVIVCGSRNLHDRKHIANVLYDIAIRFNNPTIVHGGARGVDRIAGQEAQKLGLLVEVHAADWDRYGKQAGFIRNHRMAELGADLCVALWDGRSSGTRNMIEQAKKFGIPVEIITP